VAERKPRQSRTSSKAPERGRQRKAEPITNPEARLQELSEEMFKLRFQFATRQLTNTARIRTVRKEIARVRTLQRQRELSNA
jgi:large subunit ribosomal protein L29